MPQMERIRCTKCGANYEDYDPNISVMKCESCDATFVIEQAQQYAKLEVDHQQDIARLRGLLQEGIADGNVEKMAQYAAEIRMLVPEDGLAAYCEALGHKRNGHQKLYGDFFRNVGQMTLEDAEQVLSIALRTDIYTMHDERILIMFVEHHFPAELQADRKTLIKQATDNLFEATNRYSNIPRDVFICHSSDDPIAQEVEEMLRKDGVRCWISTRNLPPNTVYYWEYIEKAIQNCRVILAIASKSCMLKPDPVRELETAGQYGLKRLELKIDEYRHTEFFRHYFDGISWVKLSPDKEQTFAELRNRVYLLLHTDNQTAPSPVDPPQIPEGVEETSVEPVEVQVRYIDWESNTTRHLEKRFLAPGEHKISFSSQLVPAGMAVDNEPEQIVRVRNGVAEPKSVFFYVRSKNIPRQVVVTYQMGENGTVAASEIVQITKDMTTIKPNHSQIPAGYSFMEPKEYELIAGQPLPEKVTFRYCMDRVLTIRYKRINSNEVLAVERRSLPYGQHTIAPDKAKTPDGYSVRAETRTVQVNDSEAIPSTISFVCEADTRKIVQYKDNVQVLYVDMAGQAIAQPTLLSLQPGNHTVVPTPGKLSGRYRMHGTDQQEIVVPRYSAMPTTVKFQYQIRPSIERFSAALLGVLLILACIACLLMALVWLPLYYNPYQVLGLLETLSAASPVFLGIINFESEIIRLITGFISPVVGYSVSQFPCIHMVLGSIILILISLFGGKRQVRRTAFYLVIACFVLLIIYANNPPAGLDSSVFVYGMMIPTIFNVAVLIFASSKRKLLRIMMPDNSASLTK